MCAERVEETRSTWREAHARWRKVPETVHPAHSTGAPSPGFTGEWFAKNRKILMIDNRFATVLRCIVPVSMPSRATSHCRRVIQYPYRVRIRLPESVGSQVENRCDDLGVARSRLRLEVSAEAWSAKHEVLKSRGKSERTGPGPRQRPPRIWRHGESGMSMSETISRPASGSVPIPARIPIGTDRWGRGSTGHRTTAPWLVHPDSNDRNLVGDLAHDVRLGRREWIARHVQNGRIKTEAANPVKAAIAAEARG